MQRYDFKQAEEFAYALSVASLTALAAAFSGVDFNQLPKDQLAWPFLAAIAGRAVLGAVMSVVPRFVAREAVATGVTEDQVRAILVELLATPKELAAVTAPPPPMAAPAPRPTPPLLPLAPPPRATPVRRTPLKGGPS